MIPLIQKDYGPEKQVIDFLQEALNLPAGTIMPWHSLEHDLKLGGEDAEELMALFATEFNVDLSHFAIGDYFGAETDINPVLAALLSLFGNARYRKILRVSDLAAAIKHGRL